MTSVRTDVAPYLERIGVTPGSPDVDTLTGIVQAHVTTIAFENLDPFTGTEPPTTRDGIGRKLVHGRRGGWCFEHNRLLHDVLDDLGYRVTPLVGRVRLGLDDDAPSTHRSHRLTLVEIDGEPWTADVGFGGTVPFAPLRLAADVEQPTVHGTYRYRRADDGVWWLQRRGSGDWRTQYVFDLVPVPDVDFVMGSFFTAHHPDSGFRNGLTAARSAHDRRWTLDGRRFTVRFPDGRAEPRELDTPSRVRETLETVFGIDTTAVTGLEARIREVHFT